MSKDIYYFKRHSHVLNVFLNYGIQGILELVFGIYLLFLENMPKSLLFIMILVDIAYAVLVIIRNKILWEIRDEVIKDNERICGYWTVNIFFLSLMIASFPFIFTKTKINIAVSFCFAISYGSFLYFAIYAVIAHWQKKLSSDICDDLPPNEEGHKEGEK